MDYSHNSLFIKLSLSSLFKKIFSKHFIYSYNRDSHKVEHSSKVSISSFRYSPFSSKFSRLMNRWINSSVSNELLGGGESFYIPDFSNKMAGGYLFESSDRFKDFNLVGMTGFTFFDEDVLNPLKFFLQNEESSDFIFKDFLIGGGYYSNRVPCGFENFRDRARSFSFSSINQSSMKRVFRDIDTTKEGEHGGTPFVRFYEAGEASQFILHSDKGSQAQLTYEDLRRQITNSLEGSNTQVKWSFPPSSLLSYQTYKFININLS